jgi:hypothetical protein
MTGEYLEPRYYPHFKEPMERTAQSETRAFRFTRAGMVSQIRMMLFFMSWSGKDLGT